MKGVIAADSKDAAEAGAEVFRQGGNALDAAKAASRDRSGYALVRQPDEVPMLYNFSRVSPGEITPITEQPPLEFTYRQHTIFAPSLPQTNGILIAYAMQLLGKAEIPGEYIFGDTRYITLLTEVIRQVLKAQRENSITLDLLSESQINTAWEHIQKALISPRSQENLSLPQSTSGRHISAIDETGLSVSLSLTDEATLQPTPLLIQTAEGQQISLSCTSLLSLPQLLCNVLDWHIPAPIVVNSPRILLEASGELHLEWGYRDYAANQLETLGYKVKRWKEKSLRFGAATIAIRRADGHFFGAGDMRSDGVVMIVDNRVKEDSPQAM